jgi:hypothetical protein
MPAHLPLHFDDADAPIKGAATWSQCDRAVDHCIKINTDRTGVRILTPVLHESPAHRIPRDVPHLCAEVFVTTDDVVVEIFLPSDTRPMLLQPKATALLEFDHRLPCVR